MRRKILSSIPVVLIALVAMSWPSVVHAQPRGRGGTRVIVARGFYGPYYGPFFSPFYSPFYDPWFGPGWGWGYPYPYGGWRLATPEASVRLDVRPRDAQVYVDGYFAGEVDQFDGAFQRLRLPPGQHEIVVYKEGYRSIRERLYLPANSSRKLTRDLDRLAAGEPHEPPPVPMPPPDEAGPDDLGSRAGVDRGVPPPPRRPVAPRPGRRVPDSGADLRAGATGTLVIRVQPEDANILIDGERWVGGGADERLVVQLPEGTHHLEVEKPGYRPVTLDVEVRGGETAPVNVSLSRE
ncbi:MAG: PEGA domain-containing protein [Vicinamibacterales bacterium]